MELVLELVPGAASSGALGAAGLDHEVIDHAVKLEPIVETVLSQLHKVGDRLGGLFVLEGQANVAAVGLDGGYFHWEYLILRVWCAGDFDLPTSLFGG